MAKKFMFVCVGLMALAGAYHLGAQNVEAQALDNKVVSFHTTLEGSQIVNFIAVTELGDIYRGEIHHESIPVNEAILVGNIFDHANAVGSDTVNLNDVKGLFR